MKGLKMKACLKSKIYLYLQYFCISFVLFTFLHSMINCAYAAGMSPKEVIKKYYIADLNGVRLSGDTYATIKPLILWEDEPGWDTIFITNEVKIHNTKIISDTEIHIECKYHIVGILTGEMLFSFDFSEVIDFILIKKGDQWKIKEPVFPPHVSLPSAKKHIERLVQSGNIEDKTTIKRYRRIIECLKNMK